MALSQMYPGMSNSPKTSLKNNITSAATSFEVDNAALLPAAPNLAVIGTDQNAEVVIYGAKNGNILTQCIRGAGGTTAKAWNQGISVARNFTNLDYTTLCNNITDLDNRKRNTADKINVGTEVTSVLPVANGGTGNNSLAGVKSWLGLAALAFKTLVNLASDVSGILPIANGGTGASTVPAARNALGLGNTSGALPIANGGTGQTTAAAARNALGLGNTSGALPIANGGTGATTKAAARNALGLGNTEGAVPVANGGTGSTNAADARTALGLANSQTGRANIGVTDIATRPDYEISTTDLINGSSALSSGKIYFFVDDQE